MKRCEEYDYDVSAGFHLNLALEFNSNNIKAAFHPLWFYCFLHNANTVLHIVGSVPVLFDQYSSLLDLQLSIMPNSFTNYKSISNGGSSVGSSPTFQYTYNKDSTRLSITDTHNSLNNVVYLYNKVKK